jgi:hypothetical protein
MYSIENERTDLTYHGNGKDIADLICERVVPGMIRSFWKPSKEEIEMLIGGGYIELVIWNEPIPPISINAITRKEAGEEYDPNGK